MLAFASALHVPAAPTFQALPYSDPFAPATSPGVLTYSQPANSILLNESLSGVGLPITRAMANISQGLDAITIEWWMKQKPAGTPITSNPDGTILHGPGFIVSADWQWGGPLGSIIVNLSQNKDGQYVGNRGVVIPNVASDEQWHHYAVTYDLRTVRSFRDGELLEQKWLDNNADRLGPFEDDSFVIKTSLIEVGGGVATSGRRFQNGFLDGVRVSKTALSPWQIKRNYENARVYTKTIHVAPNGTGSGTEASPASLTAALAQVGPSTRIILRGGTYNGSEFQVTRSATGPREHCLIVGADGTTPAIIAGGNPALSGAGHITLRNLTFSSDDGAALQINSAFKPITIDACRISGSQVGLSVSSSPAVTIQNSVVNAGLGMYFVNSPDSIVRQNTVVNGSVGIQFDTGSRRISLLNNLISGQSSVCLQIINDSQKEYRGNGNLYHPAGGYAASIAGQNFTAAQVNNKTLANAWYTFDTQDAADSRSRRIGHAAESFSMSFAPTFADPANGDFRLASVFTNAVDAGAERTFQHLAVTSETIRRGVLPTVADAMGVQRPKGNGVDVGAYETVPLNYAVFVLDADYTCSAGVYKGDGTLVRTLFSGQRKAAGTNVVFWNGLDDHRQPVASGSYTIKMIAHNVQYVWEGIVGNTSSPNANSYVHGGFEPIFAFAIFGTTAFYTSGYNENKRELYRFDTANPNKVTKSFGPIHNIYSDPAVDLATDGSKLYTLNSSQISIYNFNDCNATTFGNGSAKVNVGGGRGWIEVQRNGNLLFVSRRDQNTIYILDKTSGTVTGTIAVDQPKDLALTASGDLWVISGNTALLLQCSSTGGSVVQTITGLNNPTDIACSPVDGTVLIADAGTHQLKAFSSSGAPLWTYGQANGYANGPRVTNDKFYFLHVDQGRWTYMAPLAFQPDGTFWVGDTFMSRYLHFNMSRQLLHDFCYVPHTYNATADRNNPTRVFNRFTEYAVDYSKPMGQCWTITNFFGYGLPNHYYGFEDGVWSVVTLGNGRTYATTYDGGAGSSRQVVEITANGLRETGTRSINIYTRIEKDGSMLTYSVSGGSITFLRKPLSGFDGAGNPIWGSPVTLGSAPYSSSYLNTDPFSYRFPQMSGNLVISYDADRGRTGFHLGAVKQGTSQWLWKALPTAGGFDGYGTFDTWCEYGGSHVMTSGRNIFAGAHGEFYHDIGQANQFFHFYDNGLFIGQFGNPMVPGVSINAPGASGNSFSPVLVEVGNDLFMYHNDEWSRGSHRWKPVNLGSIVELSNAMLQGQAPSGTTNTPSSGTNTNGSGTSTNGTNYAASLPDLVVTAVSMTPASAVPGTPVRFSATIKNQGATATPVGTLIGVAFLVDGVNEAWFTTGASNIAPGASWTVSATDGPTGTGLWTATAGAHTVVAHVDRPGRITEGSDDNNTRSMAVTINNTTNSTGGPVVTIKAAGGGKVALTWPTAVGSTYQVHFKSALTNPTWTPLSATMTATSGSMTYTDAPPSSTSLRLYNVKQN